MKVENDRIIFEKSNRMLGGSNGIVYLLFIGRDTYAAKVQCLMKNTLFTHESNVNQVIGKLVKEGSDFLVSKGPYRKKGARGRKRDIYTANLDPILVTLKAFNIEFNQKELQDTLTSLAETSDFFPKFLTNIFQTSMVRRLPWHAILSSYINYLSETLRIPKLLVFPIPSDFSIKEEKVISILKTYPSLRKELQAISMQLNSPNLGLNPEFKAQINEAMEKLDSKDSEARKTLEFLQELKKLGITDFSVLLAQVKDVLNVYGR